MSLENYPLSIAPDIDQSRVQRVADAMFQFRMLAQSFHISSMLGLSRRQQPDKTVIRLISSKTPLITIR